jgi:ribosomal protein L29
MGKLKAHVLREKTKSELKTQLQDLRSELNSVSLAI